MHVCFDVKADVITILQRMGPTASLAIGWRQAQEAFCIMLPSESWITPLFRRLGEVVA